MAKKKALTGSDFWSALAGNSLLLVGFLGVLAIVGLVLMLLQVI